MTDKVVIAVYLIIQIMIFGFIILSFRKIKRLEDRLKDLKDKDKK